MIDLVLYTFIQTLKTSDSGLRHISANSKKQLLNWKTERMRDREKGRERERSENKREWAGGERRRCAKERRQC